MKLGGYTWYFYQYVCLNAITPQLIVVYCLVISILYMYYSILNPQKLVYITVVAISASYKNIKKNKIFICPLTSRRHRTIIPLANSHIMRAHNLDICVSKGRLNLGMEFTIGARHGM